MKFDYMLSNPPFGVDWKKVQKAIKDEQEQKGYAGRFGAGLPRVSDGSLLFLLHLISKIRDVNEGGSRIGIILNGSPLFTGSAGSRYILENDLLEGIVALPTDMFYNIGIATYIWILSNDKAKERKGKVQLVDATEMYGKMRKSLGHKRNMIDDYIDDVVKLYGQFAESKQSKIFDTRDFGYRRITVERPLKLAYYPKDSERVEALKNEGNKAWKNFEQASKDVLFDVLGNLPQDVYLSREGFQKDLTKGLSEQAKKLEKEPLKLNSTLTKVVQKHLAEHNDEAEVCKSKGKSEANSDLRDYENVPLKEDIYSYFEREVKPHVPDAWIDEGQG